MCFLFGTIEVEFKLNYIYRGLTVKPDGTCGNLLLSSFYSATALSVWPWLPYMFSEQ